MKKKILYTSLSILLLLIVWNFQLLSYGFSQAYGQLSIIWNTKPIEEVLNDSTVPDSIKQKLALIYEIKKFAFDSLGINKNENYTTFFDQKGKPILWVVTACPPFEMKAKEWEFPLLGRFSYKGYFNHKKALAEEKIYADLGFDTDVGEVSAWSTLGWLKDPILSSMFKRKAGSLANLIIHELTHGTLYVKNNVDFNENLASFVGDYGARKFLIQKYGIASNEFLEYEKGLKINKEYSERTLSWANRLDSLYKKFDTNYSFEQKQQLKSDMINAAKKDLTLFLKSNNYYTSGYEKVFKQLNNTYFNDYITYRSQQNSFEEEFKTTFHSNFPAYMLFLKKKYPSM